QQVERMTAGRTRRELAVGAGLTPVVDIRGWLRASTGVAVPRGRILRPGRHSGQQSVEPGRCERPVTMPHFDLDPAPLIETDAGRFIRAEILAPSRVGLLPGEP